MVKTQCFYLQGVRSMVRELRSQMLSGAAKKTVIDHLVFKLYSILLLSFVLHNNIGSVFERLLKIQERIMGDL